MKRSNSTAASAVRISPVNCRPDALSMVNAVSLDVDEAIKRDREAENTARIFCQPICQRNGSSDSKEASTAPSSSK